MRIDAHVTGRIADLVPIFERNRFDACVSAGAGDHPLVVAHEPVAPPPTLEFLVKHPDTRAALVLSPDVLELARYPNIYVKLIVTPELKGLAAEALAAYGPDRAMFASGWPECLSWKLMLASFTQACGPLPQSLREKLLGGTAAAFYKLLPSASYSIKE